MSETEGNDSAFAAAAVDSVEGAHIQLGLTKREYFAALALQGMLACPNYYEEVLLKQLTEMAVKRADDLIEELNKEQK